VHERVTDCFEFSSGQTPLLISIPHDGRDLPPEIALRMTERARELPDTDWHVDKLYQFAKGMGAGVIKANYTRYVVDLNRASNDETLYKDQFTTGLCPLKTFDGEDIYLQDQHVSDAERRDRVEKYWLPYHDRITSALTSIKRTFGYALLWDAHSIPSKVPLLFDGELPELNFGTNDGRSCAGDIVNAVTAEAALKAYSSVLNGRFKGGYITRQYGDPANDIHAIQLELAQRCYIIEETWSFDDDRATRLQSALSGSLQTYISSAASYYTGQE
jgi:N-formylglutamate amidohydrolase